MPDLIDPTSAIDSVNKEIEADKLRWKSLVHSAAAGEPSPPAKIIQRLGQQAFDFEAEQATRVFLEDVSSLKKYTNLKSQHRQAETAMKDWHKKYESRSDVETELKEVQDRSVELRTALSQHWQKENSIAAKHWKIRQIENEAKRIF